MEVVLYKTWDHLIFRIGGGGTRYTDEVSIDAGLFTLQSISTHSFTPMTNAMAETSNSILGL